MRTLALSVGLMNDGWPLGSALRSILGDLILVVVFGLLMDPVPEIIDDEPTFLAALDNCCVF